MMLKAINSRDEEDRKIKDKFYHAFSGRDSSIKEYIRKADKNIVQILLVNPVDIKYVSIPPIVSKLLRCLRLMGKKETNELTMCSLYYVEKPHSAITFSLSKTNQPGEEEISLYIYLKGLTCKVSTGDENTQQILQFLSDNTANIDEGMLNIIATS